MTNHLQNRNGTYYFRRVVPEDIRHLILTNTGKPRTEWAWSLKIKDREKAKRLLPACLTKTNVLIDQARAALKAASREVTLAPTDAQQVKSHAIADAMMQESLEAAAIDEAAIWEQECRAEEDPHFAMELELRAMKAAELRKLRTRQEDEELSHQSKVERQLSLLALYDQWAAVPGRHAKTVAQWRPYIRHLAKFIASDNIYAVTHDKLVAWRNHLRDEASYRGRPLSAKTINGSYLGAVGALFAWAKGDGIIDRNPMLEVTRVKAPRKAVLRSKGFTPNEVETILSATLDLPPSREGEDLRNAKRWCPWLMAYSGARVNEITQLRKADVYETEGVWVMRLTPDAGTLKTKKFRQVPLHSHLVEQGFLAYVESRSEGPLFFDPSKRRSDAAINRQSNRLGSKLAEWVRSLGIKDVKPNHAWRNLFASLAVRHQLDPRATRAIIGHAATDEHGKYIDDFLDVLAAQMEMLPRFEVPLEARRGHQGSDRHVQRIRHPGDIKDTDVAFAALDLAHEGTGDPGGGGECLL